MKTSNFIFTKEKENKNTTEENFRNKKQSKLVTIHQIDSIYSGQVNNSYQKEGFGILQNEEFDTYMGYFKNNKVQGLGLIIYKTGEQVYGYFQNNQLSGIGVTLNTKILQCGIFAKKQIVGIGYQYSFDDQQWKMSRYHKGVPIELIKSEVKNINEGAPQMLAIQFQILIHFNNFIEKKYFSPKFKRSHENVNENENQNHINKYYFHSIDNRLDYYGLQSQNSFLGLGVLYNKIQGKCVQIGNYQDGQLHGYGMKIQEKNNYIQFGLYTKGKKDQVFFEKMNGKMAFFLYARGIAQGTEMKEQNIDNLKKKQRLFNYRQKDFMSIKNVFNFEEILEIFDSHELKAWKQQSHTDNEKQKEKYKFKPLEIPNISKKKKQSTPKQSTLVTVQSHEKSSVQIIKQKIFNIAATLEKKGSANKSQRLRKIHESIIEGQDKKQILAKAAFDDQQKIADEQNPFLMNEVSNRRDRIKSSRRT